MQKRPMIQKDERTEKQCDEFVARPFLFIWCLLIHFRSILSVSLFSDAKG